MGLNLPRGALVSYTASKAIILVFPMKWIIPISLGAVLACALFGHSGVKAAGVAAEGSGRVQTRSISPQSGSTRGGTVVTIVGAGFIPGTTVSFGYVPATVGYKRATQVVIQSSTVMQVTTPPHPSGTVDLVVSNPDGSSATLTNAFTYTDR